MTARDDYPLLPPHGVFLTQHDAMCNEIDQLRKVVRAGHRSWEEIKDMAPRRTTAEIVADDEPHRNARRQFPLLAALDAASTNEREYGLALDKIDELDADLTLAVLDLDRIDAARPVCPTCGGTGDVNDGHAQDSPPRPCPDCPDGRMPIEREHAIVNAVFDPDLRDRVSIVGASAVIDHLRSVKR